jgi:hypothetical protein
MVSFQFAHLNLGAAKALNGFWLSKGKSQCLSITSQRSPCPETMMMMTSFGHGFHSLSRLLATLPADFGGLLASQRPRLQNPTLGVLILENQKVHR